MENWKVREVSAEPEKSKAEIEQQLIEKAEAKFKQEAEVSETATEENIDDKTPPQEVPVTEESPMPQLDEEQVLSFLKNRYNKEINTLDDLVSSKPEEEMPQEISNYLAFKKNTGKSFEEFLQLNRDFEKEDDDVVLKEFYADTKKHLDAEDIEFEINSKFGYDDSVDADDEVRKKKISKKEEVLKARQYFKDRRDEHIKVVESSTVNNPVVEDNPSKSTSDVKVEEVEKRVKHFTEKTDQYFNDSFNGFNFKINEDVISYSTGDTNEIKANHSDINNFISQHVTKDGFLIDAEKYHKSLAAAFNPDAFAKFFYEKGKADALTTDVKSAKNIDMKIRSAPVTSEKTGLKITALPTDHGNSLKIRSNRNK